jgi:hypothetical protein
LKSTTEDEAEVVSGRVIEEVAARKQENEDPIIVGEIEVEDDEDDKILW